MHAGSKKRQLARDKRAAKQKRARLNPDVAAATGLSGTYCTVHGTTHSPEAAEEMGCFE